MRAYAGDVKVRGHSLRWEDVTHLKFDFRGADAPTRYRVTFARRHIVAMGMRPGGRNGEPSAPRTRTWGRKLSLRACHRRMLR